MSPFRYRQASVSPWLPAAAAAPGSARYDGRLAAGSKGGQDRRRRIHQTQYPARAAAMARKIAVSYDWKAQKRLAGW
jgi:hypothetical protein